MSDAGLFSQGLRLGSLSELAGATGDLREALLAGRELLPLLGTATGSGGAELRPRGDDVNCPEKS